MPNQTMTVHWQVAEDRAFARVVQSGTAAADPDWAHSVHAEITGLRPGTEYFYRFSVDDHTSPVDRTKTASDPASTDPVRFGVVSCQRYEHGTATPSRGPACRTPSTAWWC
jgi:alkaline phosphatase D